MCKACTSYRGGSLQVIFKGYILTGVRTGLTDKLEATASRWGRITILYLLDLCSVYLMTCLKVCWCLGREYLYGLARSVVRTTATCILDPYYKVTLATSYR